MTRDDPWKQPGPSGRQFLERLLGAGGDLALTELRHAADRIAFEAIRGETHVGFEIEPLSGDPRDYRFATDAFGLRVKVPPDGFGPAERALATHVFHGLRECTLERLLAGVSRGPNRGASHARRGAAPYASRLDRFLKRSDHSADWWKFFLPEHRYLDAQIQSGERVVKMHFSTRECSVRDPLVAAPSLRYFKTDRQGGPPLGCTLVQVDIRERDVLAGQTMPRLQRALEHTVATHRPDVIHLMTTCLPDLIGDNPTSLIRRIEREGTRVLWTAKSRDAAGSITKWLERQLAAVAFAEVRDPGRVVVAGVAAPAAQAELRALLATLGLEVAGFLFPSTAVRAIDGLETVRALVWGDPTGWEKLGDAPFTPHLEVVRAEAPFGVAGTVAWLRQVAESLALEVAEDAIAALEPALAERLAPLRADAAGRAVALVGDRDDLEHLVRRSEGLGFSVARLLGELGFDVRCLVYAPEGDIAPVARRPLGAGHVTFTPFASREALDAALSGGVELAFSHFNHDPRLAAHGIPAFSEEVFTLGGAGLVAAGEQLLRRCHGRPFGAGGGEGAP